MFPDSFPSVPGTFPALLQGTSESELLDLFASWVDVPLTEPGVTRVIEAYIPMKLQARQQEIWKTQFQPTHKKSGLGYSNLKERPTGEQPFERMCAKCFTGAPDQAKKCWTCRHETLVPYSAPSASMDSGKETWHLLFIDGKATWVKDPKSSHGMLRRLQVLLALRSPLVRPTKPQGWWMGLVWPKLHLLPPPDQR